MRCSSFAICKAKSFDSASTLRSTVRSSSLSCSFNLRSRIRPCAAPSMSAVLPAVPFGLRTVAEQTDRQREREREKERKREGRGVRTSSQFCASSLHTGTHRGHAGVWKRESKNGIERKRREKNSKCRCKTSMLTLGYHAALYAALNLSRQQNVKQRTDASTSIVIASFSRIATRVVLSITRSNVSLKIAIRRFNKTTTTTNVKRAKMIRPSKGCRVSPPPSSDQLHPAVDCQSDASQSPSVDSHIR